MEIFHTSSSYVAVYQRVMLGNLSQNTGIAFFSVSSNMVGKPSNLGVPFPADLHVIREAETQRTVAMVGLPLPMKYSY